MLTGSTSLDLVRDELFTSMGEVEDLLQQFLEDRQNGSLLQQSIEGLQQLRGTLALIELRDLAEKIEKREAPKKYYADWVPQYHHHSWHPLMVDVGGQRVHAQSWWQLKRSSQYGNYYFLNNFGESLWPAKY